MNPKPKRSKNGASSLSQLPHAIPQTNRSMKGCETCRRRKVKCDERHPDCGPCRRLQFTCRWSQGKKPSISNIRRGCGPIKSRDGSWAPCPIISNSPKSIIVGGCATAMSGMASTLPESEWSSSVNIDVEVGSDDWWQLPEVYDDALACFVNSHSTFDLGDSELIDSCQELTDSEYLFMNHPTSDHQINSSVLDGPSPSLSDFHLTLPNSLTLNSKEHEALRHYQTTYSLYRTTKDPNWSTHKVLLHMGSRNTMIMHLLLAVSLNDYSLCSRNSAPYQEAESHFQCGAQFLISSSTTTSRPDDVTTMAAYFFVYLYMSKQKSAAPQRLSQLSSTVLSYVQTHKLIELCCDSLPSPNQPYERCNTSGQDRSLLARLIMWTLDEDVKCSFQGSGGYFARYLAKQSSRTKEIYDASRNALGDHWGTLYPHSQALDDDQNATVLEFLWALMTLWQDINDISRILEPLDLKLQIEQKFMLLENVGGLYLIY
jgi:hypothetical protein